MQVIIRPDADAAAGLTAAIVAEQVRSHPASVLGLATGSTMERVYARLVRMHRDEGLDLSLVRTFNLDEYVGLGPNDPESYHHYMNRHFLSLVNIDPRNAHLPDGLASDLDSESAAYERKIRKCGGISLQILGIGSTGHIGFNEPLSALYSRTRCKALTPRTLAQNARYFSDPARQPKRGITMGVGTILDAERIVLLATGAEKAAVLARAVEGPVTSMISASALQLHPHACVIADEPAAADLSETAYYRWIFDNEPEWAQFRMAR